MNDDVVTRREFEEYQRRLDDKKAAWDRDLDAAKQEIKELRAELKEFQALTTSVAKMAQAVETMSKELEKQGERLEAIEKRDGEMWRKSIGYILTAAITAIVTGIAAALKIK